MGYRVHNCTGEHRYLMSTVLYAVLYAVCRSCIVRYLESSQTCPVCDVPLHENSPLLGIRFATTLPRSPSDEYRAANERICLIRNSKIYYSHL